MTVTDTVDPCPLCGISLAREISRTPYAAIWRSLRDTWSARLSPAVMARHSPADEAVLWRCERCKLEYFSPLVSGDADFYEQLMRTVPYERDRWEFRVAASTVSPGEAVADFGCGRGFFLEHLPGHVQRAVGVDLNADAISELQARGLEAHNIAFADFASRERASFDAVCAFQVIEHLPRVRDVIVPALACLKPRGRLYVSVPNRQRLTFDELEPFDFPPHHVSRWASPQLDFLASEFDLDLLRITFEPPAFSAVAQLNVERAYSVMAPFVGANAARFIGRVYRRVRIDQARYARRVARGGFAKQGLYGHTMFAEYRKAGDLAE